MNKKIYSATAPHFEEETKNKQSTDINGGMTIPLNLHKSGKRIHHDPFLSREELADRWGLCIETLKRWEKSNNLPYLKIGKQVRYRLSVIEMIENGSEVLP